MLSHLSIRNFALIDELEIDFNEGLTIITGETGAGKSIVLDALGLVLGKRVDRSALRKEQKKCIVEATFRIEAYQLQSLFDSLDLDYEAESILRREINPQGKSRAFINDTPVNLQSLKLVGERLIDVHAQHQSLLLNDQGFQLHLIDVLSDTLKPHQDYIKAFRAWKAEQKRLTELQEEQRKARTDEDYYRFQFEELEQLQLKEGESEALEGELQLLENAEQIGASMHEAIQLLEEQEGSIIEQLNAIQRSLGAIEAYHPAIKHLLKQINSASLELEDVNRELQNEQESISADPQRIEIIQERLSAIYQLQQKHHLKDEAALLQLMAELDEKLNQMADHEAEIEKLESELKTKETLLWQQAEAISRKRQSQFPSIAKTIVALLTRMGMEQSKIHLERKALPSLHSDGIDQIEILFSANKGSEPAAIKKIASGGELSRLMLAIKSILANRVELPTIIFDEIDSGVSGEIAEKLGLVLKEMSQHRQVLNITHLPQMAAKGDQHLLVYKTDGVEQTNSHIKALNEEERLLEVARMLSGEKLSEAALENARTLMTA